MIKLKEKLLGLGVFLDNEYLDLYCLLIENNMQTERIKFKTQLHHSIPCLFYDSRELADLDCDNYKVNLYYHDHILAHYYLCLAATDFNSEVYFKLLFCLAQMIKPRDGSLNQYTEFKLNYDYNIVDELDCLQKLYEDYIMRLAKRNHDLNIGKHLSEEHKKKISIANTGKHLSEERRQHLREINTGKRHSEEVKKRISQSHIGQNKGHI